MTVTPDSVLLEQPALQKGGKKREYYRGERLD
jgi:hypothetical protein